MTTPLPHPSLTRISRIYFVGIGGMVMSGLAHLLHHWGKKVSGSELRANDATHALALLGIPCMLGDARPGLDPATDCVVRSPRLMSRHPDIRRAQQWGIPLVTPAQLLGIISECHETIAVAGCHGKTTVGAYLGTVCAQQGLDPSVLLRTQVEIWGSNVRAGSGQHFITEADENEKRFLALKPRIGIITNIEMDHLDYFESLDAIVRAYHQFALTTARQGLLIANYDDLLVHRALKGVRGDILWFGREEGAQVRALNVRSEHGKVTFLIHIKRGTHDVQFDCAVPGLHQVANALAVAAAAHALAVPLEPVRDAFAAYHGGNRHMELRGEKNGIIVIDDAADHPSEIKSVLKGVRMRYPKKPVWCVFQPYLENRTRYLQEEFAQCFTDADNVCVLPIVKGVEEGGGETSAEPLMNALMHYHPQVLAALPACADIPTGSVLITLGADRVRAAGDRYLM